MPPVGEETEWEMRRWREPWVSIPWSLAIIQSCLRIFSELASKYLLVVGCHTTSTVGKLQRRKAHITFSSCLRRTISKVPVNLLNKKNSSKERKNCEYMHTGGWTGINSHTLSLYHTHFYYFIKTHIDRHDCGQNKNHKDIHTKGTKKTKPKDANTFRQKRAS